MTVLSLKSVISHWLRHLSLPCLAQKTITIRVDYLMRVITFLLLIGVLTSCVPEEDAVESSSSDGNILRVGDVQILWGNTLRGTVTFIAPFSEIPTIMGGGSASGISKSEFFAMTGGGGTPLPWQAIGKYK